MPISGLVITLSPDPWRAAAALEAIREHDRIDAGHSGGQPTVGLRLPVVVDTPDRRSDRAVWDWLNSLPGVRHIDVVFIHFEEHEAGSGGQVWRRERVGKDENDALTHATRVNFSPSFPRRREPTRLVCRDRGSPPARG